MINKGGHLESGETLEEAGARELKEETGIEIDKNSLKKLALWESVFPPYIEVIIIYEYQGKKKSSLRKKKINTNSFLVVYCIINWIK